MDKPVEPVVLIVDDEVMQLRLMASLLSRSYVTLPISSAKEALRILDALQYTETHGEVCPANWSKGKSAMKADTAGVADFLAKHNQEL